MTQGPQCPTVVGLNNANSEETAKVNTDSAVQANGNPPASIGSGPAPCAPMIRRRQDLASQPKKGSTLILLDDESDDEVSAERKVGSNSFALAELVQDGAERDKRRQQNLEQATDMLRKYHPGFSQANVAKLNVYHHPRKGDRHLVVIDYAIPPALVGDLFETLLRDSFRRTEFARPDTRQYKHHIVEYDPERLRRYEITQIVSEIVKLCFPRPTDEPLEVYRVYTNAVLFGDVAFMHRDSDSDDHITALLYPNMAPAWRAEFGGETLFYDEDREIIDAVEPRAGRLCIFSGSLLHKGSPPGRLVYESRFTTAFKFSPVERQPQPVRRDSERRPTGGNDPEPQ